MACAEFFVGFEFGFGQVLDFEGFDVGDDDAVAGLEVVDFGGAVEGDEVGDIAVVALRHEFAEGAVGHAFAFGLFAAFEGE